MRNHLLCLLFLLLLSSFLHPPLASAQSSCFPAQLEVEVDSNTIVAGQTIALAITENTGGADRNLYLALDPGGVSSVNLGEIEITGDSTTRVSVTIPKSTINGEYNLSIVDNFPRIGGRFEQCSFPVSTHVVGGTDPSREVADSGSCLELGNVCEINDDSTPSTRLCSPSYICVLDGSGITGTVVTRDPLDPIRRGGLLGQACIANPIEEGSVFYSCTEGRPSSQDTTCFCDFNPSPSGVWCDNKGEPTSDSSSGKLNTAIGCIPINATDIASFFLSWGLGIGGGLAFLTILYAGFTIATSTGDPNRLQSGKDLLLAGIGGLLLLIFSIFILRFLGISVLGIL